MPMKRVSGYENYIVTDLGEVLSCSRGRVRPLRPRMGGHRMSVALYNSDGRRDFPVGHLVMEAFGSPRPNGAVMRHLNDDPDDNRIVNLAWGTQADNMRDALRNGRTVRGEHHPRSKLSEAKVIEARRLRGEGASYRDLAARYGVRRQSIEEAVKGETWGHLDGAVTARRRPNRVKP